MRRFVLAISCLAAVCGVVQANGRPATTSTINFEQGNSQNIVVGLTFGFIFSHDGGATWHWMCEKAGNYGGMYDPVYAYTHTGAVFATSFDGLLVNRDACTFASTPPGTTFVSALASGSDHALYYAAADAADSKIYRSIDDGMTFPTSSMPGILNDWWDSLMVAPGDPTRLYLSGYRFAKVCNAASSNAGTACSGNGDCPGGACEPKKTLLLFKSINSGTSFTPIVTTGMNTSDNSVIDFVGVDPTDSNIVYAKVTLENGNFGDSIYRSTTGGGNWTKILSKQDPFGLAFLVRSDHSCIAGTQTLGTSKTSTCSSCTSEATCAWTDLASPPHINCLVENPATFSTTHEVWACTHNYDAPGIPGDNAGIMKSTDLVTWTPMLRYQDIAGPVACAAGTKQQDQCVEPYSAMPSVWCCLEAQLGITSTEIDCTGDRSCGVGGDFGGDNTALLKPSPGCCESGGGSGTMLLGFGTLALLWRRRRPKS